MKKQILSTAALLVAVIVVQAQSMPGFQMGIKGAWSYSTLKSEDDQWLSSSAKSGYQLGIWTRIGGAVHVQPELYVTGKSSEASFADNGDNVQADVSFTTLDLPVLLGSRVGLGGAAIRFQAGPLISFVIDKDIAEALSQVLDIDDYRKKAFSVVGGVGLDVGKLRADIRYEHALNSISGENSIDQRMNVWTVGVGLRLF